MTNLFREEDTSFVLEGDAMHDMILCGLGTVPGIRRLEKLKCEVSPFADAIDSAFKKVMVLNQDVMKGMGDTELALFPNLTILDLSQNSKVTDKGIKGLNFLSTLNLKSNRRITDEGIKDLNLTNLNLSDNYNIIDNGIKDMTSLKNLDLSNNRIITDEGLKRIQHVKIIR